MTPIEALQVLSKATELLNTTRQNHSAILEALTALENVVKTPAPPKAVESNGNGKG